MSGVNYTLAVRDRSKAAGIARLVLYALASRADKDGVCFPSYPKLMADTGLSLGGLRKAIAKIPKNEIQVVRKGRSAGIGNSTHYRITIGCKPSDCAPIGHSNCAPIGHSQDDQLCPNRAVTVSPQDTNCVPIGHLSIKEVSIEVDKAPDFSLSQEPTRKKKTSSPGRKPSGFEEFKDYCHSFATLKGFNLPQDWEYLYDKFEACGWTLASGKALSDWKSHARNYIRRGFHIPSASYYNSNGHKPHADKPCV